MSDIFIIEGYRYNVAETAMLMKHKAKVAVAGEVFELNFPQDAPRMIKSIKYAKDNKSVYISKAEDYDDYSKVKLYHAKLEASDSIDCDFVADNILAYSVDTTKNGDIYYATVKDERGNTSLWKNSELLYDEATIYNISEDGRHVHISLLTSVDSPENTYNYRSILLTDGKETILDEEGEVYVRIDKNNNIIFAKFTDINTGLQNIYIYDEVYGKRLIVEGAKLVEIELDEEDFVG